MPTLSAQITLSWDGNQIRCEAPGSNGSRRKIADATFDDLPLWLKTELLSQLEEQRDKQRQALMATQRENVQYVAENHNVGLATKIWGKDWVASRVLKARIARAGQFDPISGKIVSETQRDPKTKKPINHAQALDLEFDL